MQTIYILLTCTKVSVAVLVKVLNSQNFHTIIFLQLQKLSAIFHLLPELFPCRLNILD